MAKQTDVRRRAQQMAGSKKNKEKKGIREYFKGVRLEMKKGTWSLYGYSSDYMRCIRCCVLAYRYRIFGRTQRTAGHKHVKKGRKCQKEKISLL